MKLKISTNELKKGLDLVSRFTSSHAQLPILSNILFEGKNNALAISSTNLETSIYVRIGAKIDEDGSIALPAKVVTDLIQSTSGDFVEIKSGDDKINIKSARFSSNIVGTPIDDFPSVPKSIKRKSFSFKVNDFATVLSKVLFAISSDETRPVLTGSLIKKEGKNLEIVGTDGARLSYMMVSYEGLGEDFSSILPKGILYEILKFSEWGEDLDISFDKENNQVIFAVGPLVASSRIIQGNFPEYKKIMPSKFDIEAEVDKQELSDAVKASSVLARDSSNVVKFKIMKDTISLTSESTRFGNQESIIDAKVDFKESLEKTKNGFEIAFNYRFIEEFLKTTQGETVKIGLNGENLPVQFSDAKIPNYIHIIMPIMPVRT